MRLGSLFSGYGGLDLAADHVLGTRTVWHADIDPAAAKVLAHRWPSVPNLGDVSTVDWTTVEPVDVLTGGFPCQDVSSAGRRRGIQPDTRSGLWNRMADAIDGLRPALVVIENVRGLLSAPAHSDLEPCPWCVGDEPTRPVLRALGAVLGDLADLGYDTRWCGLRAADLGAPHNRFRVFIAAWPTAADPDRLGHHRDQRPQLRPIQPADQRGQAATDPDGDGQQRTGTARPGWPLGDRRRPTNQSRQAAADPARLGRNEGLPAATGQLRRPDADARRDRPSQYGRRAAPVANAAGQRYRNGQPTSEPRLRPADVTGDPRTDWGPYSPAIRRWEAILGRAAPAPTIRGTRGQPKLSPSFVEWMQGLPEGHVTAVPGLSTNDMLRLLGNGVVPHQASQALRQLLPV